ncbi:hypothetical protein A1O3_03311 [Capronia epimyces CBS 606.96]|uniref:Zn(2)-C6 fungal-type domain-containing protein n=1 Tax=Capronia epimyces CBS 606.96 TaxID=1182542 RepID=W9Y9R7_9EURO|nr:uncharacterized protein A1O3_03311 [Capronia epimyces CBS 606.96]EXJ86360.1 hypothetical protein A1O3_03311 [Capronia epimyces CBS 606.96]
MSKSPLPCRDANCKHEECYWMRQIKQLEQRIGDEVLRGSKTESKYEVLKANYAHLEASMRAREKEKSEMNERILSLEASLKEKSEALEAEKATTAEIRDKLRLVSFNKQHQLVLAQQALRFVNKVQLDKSDTRSDIIHDYTNRLGTDINLPTLPSEKQASGMARNTKRSRSEEPGDDSARKQAARPRIPPQREKCGLEKPFCAQCIKSRRACTGYSRYPIFIQHKIPADDQAKSVVCHRRPPQQQTVLSILEPVKSALRQVGQVDPSPAIRQQLLEEYLSFHLPKAHLGPMHRRLWLCQLPTMLYLNSALEVSAMALCVAKLSEVYDGDPTLQYESLRLYQRGLHQLQKALWDPELMYHEQTLAACIALATYELSQCPSNSKHGYISHTSGCERLMQLRGPEAHTEGLAHQIFVQFRVQSILYALDTKQPTFLSEPVWQEVPWQSHPKTLFDQVYDFVTIAPELQRQGELLAYMDSDSRLRLATEMITKCWKMDRDLASFHDELVRSQAGPLYWPELARGQICDEDGEDGRLFPVAFHFPHLSVAHTLLVFWACQTMLWQGMYQLYRVMATLRGSFATSSRSKELLFEPDASTRFSDLPALEHRIDFAAPARNIFQSVEYCLLDEMKDHGPKSIAASLRIANETLKHHLAYRRDVLWAEEAMVKVQGRSLRLLVYYTETATSVQLNGRERLDK